MDATERPLKVPPEFSAYAEKHHIFEVFQRILTGLIIKKPDDPLPFIHDFLKHLKDVPQILILGPPCSGKTTIAKLLSLKFQCHHITDESIFTQEVLNMFNVSHHSQIPINDWIELVKNKLEKLESTNAGWVMDGIIISRQHALFLSATGYFPNHTVILKAPESVLLSRAEGRFVDSLTGEVFHNTFKPPSNHENEAEPSDKTERPAMSKEMETKIRGDINDYCLRKEPIVRTYQHTAKEVNADQPIDDVYSQVVKFVCQPGRSNAPHTPRVIFFGPPGCGKETIAKMFAEKYKINLISYKNAKIHEIGKQTKLGEIFKLCTETCTPEPDEAMFDLVRNELEKIEQPSRGWITYGFPINQVQAEYLQGAGFEANRVFFFEISNDKIMQRLTLQGVDPLTGKYYHAIANPPENDAVKDRLEVPPSCVPENVCYRITQYRNSEAKLKEFYADVAFTVDAELETKLVFENIESMIVNLIPNCPAPEAEPAL